MDKQYYVYILSNYKNGTLYVGVTGDIISRTWQHKEKISPKSFTTRYGLNKLVYYEIFGDIYMAITREKQLKGGSRLTKIKLIEKNNPLWEDLYEKL